MLFRSLVVLGGVAELGVALGAGTDPDVGLEPAGPRREHDHARAEVDRLLDIMRDEQRGLADRKSTRLNSSHSSISYAVFCLKKKNNYRRDLRGIGREVRAARVRQG